MTWSVRGSSPYHLEARQSMTVAHAGKPGFGAGEQVPDNDQDGAGDGDLGFGPAAAAGDALVALAAEGRGAGGGLAEVAAQVAVALAFLPVRVRGPDWWAEGYRPAQETRWAAVGKRDMSRPVSAMIERASSALTPGICASRWAAGSAAASAPVPAAGPVLPSASTPQAARICARCCSIRV